MSAPVPTAPGGGLRVGVRVPQYGASWAELRDTALRCERLGFHGLWVNDHLQSPGRIKAEPAFDALVTLSALAVLTSRPRLGVVVLSASYRPAALAAKMATLIDVVSDGRLTLGLGTGSDRPEHAAYGFPFGTPGQRTAAVREALTVLRAMFDHPEGATVAGVLEQAPNLPPPVQPGGPPIWMAAHRPRLLQLAGRRADGIVAAFCDAEELGRRRAAADGAREEAGRPPLDCCLYNFALPVSSRGEAESWLAAEAAHLGSTPRKLLRWLEGKGLVADPPALRDLLGGYARAGATEAALVLPSRVPPEAFDALAEAVLPAEASPAHGGTPTAAGDGAPPQAEPRRAPVRPARGSAQANLAHLLVERHRAERGDAPAAVDDGGTWSVDELGEAAARAAGALAAGGVRRGERVALPLRDGRPWLAAFLGAAWLGAVPVPLDPAMDPEMLADILDDCEPGLVVVEEGEEAAAGDWPALPREALADGPPRPLAPVHPEDLAYLIYSSGSTGRPKAAMHAHRDLLPGVEGYGRGVLGLGPGDRCHSVAKLYTSLGFGNGFFRPLGAGATAVLSALRPTVRSVLDTVEREGVTLLTGVPTFWAQLAEFLTRRPRPEALATVRLAVSSGDSLPLPVSTRLREVSGIELIEGLGCSECSNIVISTRPGEPMPGTLGRATPGVEIRLADADGRPVPSGTPGRLWIRSDGNTTGYWRRSALTRELVMGSWLRMGDMLREDDGVYRHLGRSDDLFKVDARWVSPTEVEACLLDHPGIAQAAVVGRPDDAGLLRVAAYVVVAEGAPPGDDLADALRRHVARALEPHKAPQVVTVLDDLPRLASGKIDRRRLREG